MKRVIVILAALILLAMALPIAARHLCVGDCEAPAQPTATLAPIVYPSPTITATDAPDLASPPMEQPPPDYPAPQPTNAPGDYPEPQTTATAPIIEQGPTPTPPNPATD